MISLSPLTQRTFVFDTDGILRVLRMATMCLQRGSIIILTENRQTMHSTKVTTLKKGVGLRAIQRWQFVIERRLSFVLQTARLGIPDLGVQNC